MIELCLAFIFGITYSTIFLSALIPHLLLVIIMGLILVKIQNENRVKYCLILLIILLGIFWYWIWQPVPNVNDPGKYAPSYSCRIIGVVHEEPVVVRNHFKFLFLVEKLKCGNNSKKVNGYTLSKIKFFTLPPNILYGDRLELFGDIVLPARSKNYSRFSYRDFLARKGVFSVYKTKMYKTLNYNQSSQLFSKLIHFRNQVFQIFDEHLSDDNSAFIKSLVFGSLNTALSEELNKSFNQLGLQHILAVSGYQISLIMMVGIYILKQIGFTRLFTSLIVGILTIIYIVLTGAPPSVLRAGIVGGFGLVSYVLYRNVDPLKGLLFAACILLVFQPTLIANIGFQFSVLATAGLILSAKEIQECFSYLPLHVSELLAVPIAAQIWVLPLQIYYFNSFSWMFLPANLIAGVFLTSLTLLGFVIALLGLVWLTLAKYLCFLSAILMDIFFSLILLVSKIPSPQQYLWEISVWSVLFGYLFILSFTSKEPLLKLPCLMLLVCSIHSDLSYRKNLCEAKITIFDLPKGRSILFEAQSRTILLNSGVKTNSFNEGESIILPYLKHQGISNIDLFLLTDLHLNTAFKEILKTIHLERVWSFPQAFIEVDDMELRSLIQTKKIQYEKPYENSVFNVSPVASLKILQVEPLVIGFFFHSFKILIGGKMHFNILKKLNPDVIVSDKSIDSLFSPKVSIILKKVSKNIHKNAKTFYLKKDGAICLCLNQNSFWIKSEYTSLEKFFINYDYVNQG